MPSKETAGCCRTCVLPSTFPGVDLDDAGFCRFCREFESSPISSPDLDQKLALAVESHRGSSSHDCIVAFSGGKDSTYTLWRLTEELGLKCLPVMIDNGFLSETAIENGRRVTEKLGCELHMVQPDPTFMRELFKISDQPGLHSAAALRRASGICNSCIGVINDTVIREAVERQVTLIAGGYLAGQIPHGAVTMKVNVQSHLRFEELRRNRWRQMLSEKAASHIPPSWTPGSQSENVTIINPMLAWCPREEGIFARLQKLGWEKPTDTGAASSNCRLNDHGIARHIALHGYHPYVQEWAAQVRQGLMSREEALRRIAAAPRGIGLLESK